MSFRICKAVAAPPKSEARLPGYLPSLLAGGELAAGGGDVVAALGADAVADAARAQQVAEGADRLAAGDEVGGGGAVHRDEVDVAELAQGSQQGGQLARVLRLIVDPGEQDIL